MSLSDRIRPNSEAARWVVEEVKQMEERIRLLISERDSALRRAEQQWKVREDLQAELGTSDPAEAVREIRKLKAKVKQLEAKP